MSILFILFSLFNGALLSFQQALNAALGVRLGSMGSSVMNCLAGTLFAGILLLMGFQTGQFKTVGVPLIYFLGGGLGVCMVAMSNYAIPRIGIVMTAILFTTSQLFASSLIDHFGLLGAKAMPLTFFHGIGIVLLAVGAMLVFTKEKSRSAPPIPQKTSLENLP
ncbi:MAG: DMT family transporter [Deltaproteobacteria bacterium]|nr:DMT family transporter [Deltaproteobacteria bacterium]MBI4223588.1 DMT family transporter [Deltaproteobacteria bacterium]